MAFNFNKDAATTPDPGTSPQPGAADDTAALKAAIAAAVSGAGGVGSSGKVKDAPTLIPMWKTRPASTSAPRASFFDKEPIPSMIANPANDPLSGAARVSNAADARGIAMTSFLDMTDDDKVAFIALAQKAGWLGRDGSFTGADVASAWEKSVGAAVSYNLDKSDDRAISPWEAVTRTALSGAAGGGAAFKGDKIINDAAPRTSTNRSVKSYSDAELKSTANQVLSQEFGRDATPAEIRAYTLAVNNASASSPQVRQVKI